MKILNLAVLFFATAILFSSCSQEKDYTDKTDEMITDIINAYKDVKTVSFYFDRTYKNDNDKYVTKAQIIQAVDPDIPMKYKVRVENLGDDEPLITYNGEDSRRINYKDKIIEIAENGVYDVNQGIRFISGNYIQSVLSYQINNDNLYSRFTSIFDSLYYSGVEERNGRKVQVLTGFYALEEYNLTELYKYYFDAKTMHLVEYENFYVMNQDTSFENIVFSNLEFNVDVSDDLFTAKAPMGFEDEYWKPQAPVEPLPAGAVAPAWTLTSQDGNQVSLSDYKGKVVLLDFWGTWCHWCKVAFPKLKELDDKFSDDKFVIVGISCNEPKNADPAAMLKEYGLDYKTMLQGEEVAKAYNVQGYPTMYLIGKDGKVIFNQSGYNEDMAEELAKLINENL